jgi:hypothetical protein
MSTTLILFMTGYALAAVVVAWATEVTTKRD